MNYQKYDLVMKTPMGNLDCAALLSVDGTALSGSLTFMGGAYEFSDGTIDELGNLRIYGSVPMPMGKTDFTITGTLKDGKIEAVAKTTFGEIPIRSK